MGFVTRLFFVSSEPRFGRGRSIGSLPQWTLQRSLDIDERTVLAAMAALQLLAPRLALHLRVPPDDGGPLVEVLDVDRAASALSALLPPEHLTESRVALAAGWLGAKGATPLDDLGGNVDPVLIPAGACRCRSTGTAWRGLH